MRAAWAASCAGRCATSHCQPAAGKNGLGQPHRLELKVVNLIAQGVTNRSVATQLYLSPNTVKTHIRSAFTKLGINSRAQLTQLMRDLIDQLVGSGIP